MLAFAAFVALLAQTEFRPGPETRWISEGLKLSVREGFIPGVVLGYSNRNTEDFRSRYEVAVLIHESVAAQLERAESVLDCDANDLERASLIRAGALLPFYRRGAKEFALELKNLGVEDDFGIGRLETLTKRLVRQSSSQAQPFPDVSANHWAAKAVGDLRALGMIQGYPDGRFKG